MRGVLYILIAVLLASSSFGATLHGTIYDSDLNALKGVIIEVDSSPAQRHISKYGGYSFELETGNYTLTVMSSNSRNIYAKEQVTISGKGDYVVDISVDQEVSDINYGYIILGTLLFLAIIAMSILAYFYISHKKSPKKENLDIKSGDDVIKERIIKIIVSNNNQITQKEIRKKVSLSEAKISQIITDLERAEKIKKIKKGRVNVIIVS